MFRRSTKRKLLNIISNKKFVQTVLVIVVVWWGLYYYPLFFGSNPSDVVFTQINEDEYTRITDEVQAQSVLVYNLTKDDIVYGKNIDLLLPLASISKLVTVLAISKYLEGSDVSIITDEDFNIAGHTNLLRNEKWVSRDLLEYSLIESSNRGINAIVRTIQEKTGKSFKDIVDEYLRENNLSETHLFNPSGLDIHEGLSSSESSARGIVEILKLFFENEPSLSLTTSQKTQSFHSLSGTRYIATNTNPFVKRWEVLLSKTGFTNKAGGNLVIAIRSDSEEIFFLIVLNSTKQGRFNDMEILLEKLKSAY